jgi:RND family efflux transporter MFP subunit
MIKKRTLTIIIIICLGLLALAAYRISKTRTLAKGRKQSVPVVATELPQRITIFQSLHLTGDIMAIQEAQVFAKVYGNIEAEYVNMGDNVRKDQLLALIDTTELAQQYRQAYATYQNSRDNRDRAKALSQQNLISSQDVETAETALKIAEANYQAAQTHLDYAHVKAPFSGIITKRYFDQGAQVGTTNATLFDLADIEVVKVIVDILENEVPLVNIGTRAIITVDAYPDKQFEAAIARISEAVNPNTRTMPVEVDIPNKDHILKPGMFASVSLVISAKENVLTVPTQAVVRDTSGNVVYVAKNDFAVKKVITTGIEQNSRIEISSGLQDSDRVIVAGQQYIKDKSQIKIQP